MKRMSPILFLLTVYSLFVGCEMENSAEKPAAQKRTKTVDVENVEFESSVNAEFVVIEISAGSREKWEVNKETGQLERDSVDGVPRTIHFLGYPANYGYLPKTLLPKEQGGDGDPLDAIVLGDPIERGSLVNAKPLGVLKLKDRGEQDDKILMVRKDSEFAACASLDELNERYPELCTILELWFTSYKGPGKMTSTGWGDENQAKQIIETAKKHYK